MSRLDCVYLVYGFDSMDGSMGRDYLVGVFATQERADVEAARLNVKRLTKPSFQAQNVGAE